MCKKKKPTEGAIIKWTLGSTIQDTNLDKAIILSFWFDQKFKHTINIVKASIDNVTEEEDIYIRNYNAIYPSGFNLRYNGGARGNLTIKLVKYMRTFDSKKEIGIAKKKWKISIIILPSVW